MGYALQITLTGLTGAVVAKGFLTDPEPTPETAQTTLVNIWHTGVSDLTLKDGGKIIKLGEKVLDNVVLTAEVVEA